MILKDKEAAVSLQLLAAAPDAAGGGQGLHDAVAVAVGFVLFLQRLNVDVKLFDFLPDGSNGCS